MFRAAILLAITGIQLFAGALYVEVTKADANPEAKAMKAVAVARVGACTQPPKSVLRAELLRLNGDQIGKSELKLTPLKEAGAYALVGEIPEGSVIEIVATHPLYSHTPSLLFRMGAQGPEWASVKQFYSTLPTNGDLMGEFKPPLQAKR